jgi:plasmid maintenance system antidote protein VapI
MRRNTAIVYRAGYTPNHLLDTLMDRLRLKSDAALARALGIPASTISKVRNRQMAVNSTLLLAAHEVTEMSIRELRTLLGDTETKYWLGDLDLGGMNEKKTPAFIERPLKTPAPAQMQAH